MKEQAMLGMKIAGDAGGSITSVDPKDIKSVTRLASGTASDERRLSGENAELTRRPSTVDKQPARMGLAFWGARDHGANLEILKRLAERGESFRDVDCYIMVMDGADKPGQSEFIGYCSAAFKSAKVFSTVRHKTVGIDAAALYEFSGFIAQNGGNECILYCIKMPEVSSLTARILMEHNMARSTGKLFIGITGNAIPKVPRTTFVAPRDWAFNPLTPLFRGYGSGLTHPPMQYMAGEMVPLMMASPTIKEIFAVRDATAENPVATKPSTKETGRAYEAGYDAGYEDAKKEFSSDTNATTPGEPVSGEADNRAAALTLGLVETVEMSTDDIKAKILAEGVDWMKGSEYHMAVITALVEDPAALRLMAKASADHTKAQKAAK